MIVCRMVGGLGNQMFQYAVGRALALRLGVDFRIDRRAFTQYKTHAFGMNCFQAELNDAPPELLPSARIEGRLHRWFRKRLPAPLKVFAENAFTFDANVLSLSDGTYLDGYWQSEKYFDDFADVIRSDFHVRPAPSEANRRWLEQIAATHSVSLHIRRGDYVTNSSAASVHGTCGLDYYERAVTHVRAATGIDPELYVFSDDPDWVASNLKLSYQMHLVRDNDAATNYEDLRLMSACRHHIIANSSFSWWGAWLDPCPDKIVVAPQRWFRAEDLNDCDLIPSGWVRK